MNLDTIIYILEQLLTKENTEYYREGLIKTINHFKKVKTDIGVTRTNYVVFVFDDKKHKEIIEKISKL